MTDKSKDVVVDFFDKVREESVVGEGAIRPMNRSAADAVAGAFFQTTCTGYGQGGGDQ